MLCFIVDYFYERFVLLLSCSHGRCALLRPVLLLLLVAGLLVASARWLVVACVLYSAVHKNPVSHHGVHRACVGGSYFSII